MTNELTIITTKKFNLRPVKLSDASMVAEKINNRTISRNTATIPYPYTLQDARNWVRKCVNDDKKKMSDNMRFIIEIDSALAGCVGVHKIVSGHKAEIGYWLAKEYWGRGLMTEVVKVVTKYAIKKFGLKRVYAGVYSYNPASMRVLEKAGYQLEGIEKKSIKKSSRYIDKHLFAKVI